MGMGDMSTTSMSMSMSMSPTSTMSGMDMATSTASPMSMPSGETMMGMDSMAMAFFTSPNTPLYSMSWTPKSAGQYAGTCIFLIILAAIFRALIAFRVNFYNILAAAKRRRIRGLDGTHYLREKSTPRPWRADEAVAAAFTDVVIAGVSYLLSVFLFENRQLGANHATGCLQ